MKNLILMLIAVMFIGYSCQKEEVPTISYDSGKKSVSADDYCIIGYDIWQGSSVNDVITGDIAYNNSSLNRSTYGGLYPYSLLDEVEAEYPGYRVPTYMDYYNALTSLGGASVAGGKMKETGTSHWTSPNTDATNSSDFTGLPGGYAVVDNFEDDTTFSGLGTVAYFWTSSAHISEEGCHWALRLDYNSGEASLVALDDDTYASVRLVKDGFEDETETLLTSGRYDDYPSSNLAKLIDLTIYRIKIAGIYDETDAWYVRGVHESKLALQNWYENDHNTTNNGCTFVEGQGFDGDGSNDYLENDFNPYVDAVNMTLTSASVAFMQYTVSSASGKNILGAHDSNNNPLYVLFYTTGNDRMYLNSNTYNGNVNYASGDHIGYRRIVTESTSHQGYKNGSLEGSQTTGLSCSNLVNLNLYELAYNYQGTASGFNNGIMSWSWYGGALDGTQMSELHKAMKYFFDNVDSAL